MTKNYVLIGAGFVAPRHYRAIKETGGNLLAILDPHDSVGAVDAYFKDCKYFKEYERFDRFCIERSIDYAVICSPNYLHSAHSLWALRSGFSVICEKPLALNSRNLDALIVAEKKYHQKVWNILQLRLSPQIQEMKHCIEDTNVVDVVYYTPRGDWYDYSWKGDVEKSGGLITNIGVHLLDLLLHLFGPEWYIRSCKKTNRRSELHLKMGCTTEEVVLGNTNVTVKLSIEKDKQATRVFRINGCEFDLSQNFGDLHTASYEAILNGKGFGIDTVFPAIELCSYLRGLK